MSYTRLEISDNTPVAMKNFIDQHLDMQVADIHCMLRLPIPELTLHSGFNFAAANSLLALVSGTAALISENINTKGGSGDLFKEVLKRYYPWNVQPPTNKDVETTIKHLYEYFRNPLSHSLGLRNAGNFLVLIVKAPLSETDIEKLEKRDSPDAPAIIYEPIELNGENIERIELHVPQFYWGVRKMIKRLTEDVIQMEKTEEEELQKLGLR